MTELYMVFLGFMATVSTLGVLLCFLFGRRYEVEWLEEELRKESERCNRLLELCEGYCNALKACQKGGSPPDEESPDGV